MSQCPVCHAQVADDFGLVECANCGSQLLVHMDGRVEHNGAQVPEEPAPEAPMAEDVLSDEAVATDGEVFEFDDPPQEFDLASAVEDPPQEFASEPAGEPEPAPHADFLSEVESEAAPEMYSAAPATSDSSDLSDIADFGNSDASAGRYGSLRYNIMIAGIDTSDVREAFRDIVTDRKFLWDADQLLRKIKNGHVRIENIGPAKAHMLISRLRTLPVKVEWEQYAITQG